MSTNDISFKLHSIKTEQFAIIEDIYNEANSVQLESNYRFGSVIPEKLVAVLVNYKFKTPNGVFLIIEVNCMFGIKPDSWDSIYNVDKSELIDNLLKLNGRPRKCIEFKTPKEVLFSSSH